MKKAAIAVIFCALFLVIIFSVTHDTPIDQKEATSIAVDRLKDFAKQNNINYQVFMMPEIRREKFWEFYYTTKGITPKYDVAIFVYDNRGSELKFMKGH